MSNRIDLKGAISTEDFSEDSSKKKDQTAKPMNIDRLTTTDAIVEA